MGVLYVVFPLDQQMAEYLRSIEVKLPRADSWGRNPTLEQVRAVCAALPDMQVEISSSRQWWHASFRGRADRQIEAWADLHVSDFNGNESLPHSICFEKGWPCLMLRIVHALSAYCGTLVVVPDTGCAPIAVSAGDDPARLLASWEHARPADS
jgi:hypothetical protein